MSQVTVSGSASASTTTLYQVTSGKTLYLNAHTMQVMNDGGAAGSGALFVTDASDVIQYVIEQNYLPANIVVFKNQAYPKALQIPSQYKIKCNSANADIYTYAFIHGFEV